MDNKEKAKSKPRLSLPTVLFALGAVLISFGAGLLYMPAGFICAGVCCAALGLLAAKGGAADG